VRVSTKPIPQKGTVKRTQIFLWEEKNGRQTMRLNVTVNPYINKTALTSLQDFWCRQDEEPPHVAQVRCAVSDSTLPRKKNGWQEVQWSARSQDLFPVSFVGTFKSSCTNTT